MEKIRKRITEIDISNLISNYSTSEKEFENAKTGQKSISISLKIEDEKKNILEIEMVRGAHLPGGSEIAKAIKYNGQDKWHFKKNLPNQHIGKIIERNKGLFLLIIAQNFHNNPDKAIVAGITEILPINYLVSRLLIKTSDNTRDYIGDEQTDTTLRLKKELAAEYNCCFSLTPGENNLQDEIMAQESKKNDKLRLQDEERRKKALEKYDRINSRPGIDFWTINGIKLNGVPVTREETLNLREKARAVVVSSYDDETRAYGELIEAFIISQKDGNKIKKSNLQKPIFNEAPIESLGKIRFYVPEIGNKDIFHFAEKKLEIQNMFMRKGLNNIFFAVGKKNHEGGIAVFYLSGGKTKDYGHLIPISESINTQES